MRRSTQGTSHLAARPIGGGHRERGFAVLAVLFILMLGVASIGLTFNRPKSASDMSDDRTAETFAEVKAALIGYAARQGVFLCKEPVDPACLAQVTSATAPKLGEFPCPDITSDGVAEPTCATERIGRVPWRTLGIPEPKDSAGETLWYAVSLRFLNTASNPIAKVGGYTSSGALNSSTPGDITVRGPDGSAQTTAAIAVIFSPGAPIGNQSRSTSVLQTCAGVANVRQDRCVTNYLETSGTTSNTIVGGPFIAGAADANFNDRLAYISATELMPVLEMRLGAELRALLLAYKWNSECLCYPWADSWTYSGGIADIGLNRGRLPTTAEPENWGTGNIPPYPAWAKDNDWHNQVYYSASKAETEGAGSVCLSCSPNATLSVKRTAAGTAVDPAGAVVITPGTPKPGVNRPYLPSSEVSLGVSGLLYADVFASYFEDPLNNNKIACPGSLNTEHASSPGTFPKQIADVSCDTMVQPQSRGYDRDRLWMIAPETTAQVCSGAGPALVAQVPCKGSSKDKVRDVCENLAAKLQQCSPVCARAATDMITVPCLNNTSSSQCPGPRAALLACTPAPT